jgi:prepilin-type N-terminal cleavage/methylation domain-containing protein
MNTRIAARTRVSAFTLIELLTVIAIIAILMALLFPAIGAVRESARKTQAKTDEMQVVAAVKAYNTEYGKYPNVQPNATTTAGDTLVGDMDTTSGMGSQPVADNNTLFDIIRNIADNSANKDNQGNPRRIVFFEGKAVSNPSAPKSGFLDNTANGGKASSKGGFYDPWGTEYFVYLDTDYDNQIDVSANYQDFPKDSSPQVGVAVFSLGKDRSLGSPSAGVNSKYKSGNNTSDDVLSWQ